MKLSSRGRIAVLAMIDLVQQAHRRPVALASIGRRQGISLSYLEGLFGALRLHGLVVSVRGHAGGYLPARPCGEISVADIVAAVDWPIVSIGCGGKGDCMGPGTGLCLAHELWAGLNERLVESLRAVTLKDLAGDTACVPAQKTSIRRAFLPRPAPQPLKASGPNSVFALGRGE